MNDQNILSLQAELEEKLAEKIRTAYGTSSANWNDLSIFQGNLINYGYWKNIPLNTRLTVPQRIESALALYEQVAAHLQISKDDHVLEMGCGRGVGAAHLYQHYCPAYLAGIDITPSQIQKAKQLRQQLSFPNQNFDFFVSSAENVFFKSHSFDKIYSVEVLQHFFPLQRFAKEANRILKPSGRLVVATYFPTGKVNTETLITMLPLIGEGLENPTPIQEVMQIFLEAGFSSMQLHTIGQDVFPGYDAWAHQVGAKNIFTYQYLEAYKQKMINYYILVLSPTKG